ncbi:growth hormone releasing hormone receptor, like isoform X4 [Dunckerocampus dactyliophorus]|uniref:growth hormone releasing hormone receptor, like isoform X4 n=1 Tax=Dunckerocampus dactyliophorus TaxID=161453 RepID=UPI002405CACD|nr:growth hormone releasing hormone receptor, like isoform X4 [Dunckerocampus dactyliophorus]
MDLPLLILREGERGERERGAQYPELLPSMGSTRHKLAPRRVDANMLRMQSRGAFLALCLAPAALTSLLHPECEFIFQLEKDERRCLRSIAGEANTSAQGCRAFWDAVVCWPHAVVGESVHRACPAVFSLFRNSTGSVSRNCTDGGWSRPYPPYHVACSVDDDIPETEQSYFATVKLIYTIGYSVSLLVLTAAVLILLLFRRLRCARNFIHIQLFLTFILKAAAVFIKDATLFSNDETNHCTLSTFGCKAAVVFCHYCVMANFFWLLVEALYLNSLLLSSFYRSIPCLWGFSLLGWGVPVLFIVLWIGSRVYFEDTECWDINEDSLYWWIIKGPIVVSIVVNFMLFVNIVRILIQKLSPRLIQFNNSSQYRVCLWQSSTAFSIKRCRKRCTCSG